MADNLSEILDIARRECPDIPAEVWERIALKIRINFGGQRPYIANRKKKSHLLMLAEMDLQEDRRRLAAKLGVSVRTVSRLKNYVKE